MEIYDSLFSPGQVLSRQIAQEVFEAMPEQSPVVIIMGKEGDCWQSNSEEFSKLKVDESLLEQLRAKIDDGAEPVVTQANDCSFVAGQLRTEHSDCGYVVIALPKYSPESTLANIDLIELLLSVINLVAALIERTGRLCELQQKQLGLYSRSDAVSN